MVSYFTYLFAFWLLFQSIVNTEFFITRNFYQNFATVKKNYMIFEKTTQYFSNKILKHSNFSRWNRDLTIKLDDEGWCRRTNPRILSKRIQRNVSFYSFFNRLWHKWSNVDHLTVLDFVTVFFCLKKKPKKQ